ncbi:DNA-3-methyladenine glycosylase I [Diaphorobacter sp. HDW4A]|uniref:DNA-3-methyladenine glycosylase I n=1 Tax=Diaphorobacter sp. HDW4A TaxID=2714924 RepID=UPI001408AB38|nr:DNA-3-methyladenine glycosylase I [Diaphorobacter sp. HDW4A]QIL81983.1 DNA-3-methyladenine glycosylase I [Diaphorobacter sp. HDW4A]
MADSKHTHEPVAGLFTDDSGHQRCFWCEASPLYKHYHDHEWGFPVDDDRRLFEKLCLEGFQAGLSWITILNKRESFRSGFANFEAEELSRFGEKDIARLLADAGIVRHRGKIESTINNAKRVIELRREFGSLGAYVWGYESQAGQERPKVNTYDAVRAITATQASLALSKDLKKRGWSFVGPTTMYAFMQAMGLVNDHIDGCHVHKAAAEARNRFKIPQRS